MVEKTNTETGMVAEATATVAAPSATPKTLKQKIAWILLKITAPLVWMYVICKIFILDVDSHIFQLFAPPKGQVSPTQKSSLMS